MSSLLENYINFIMRNRIWIITVILLSSIAASSGMSKLTFASDYRVFFGEDNPDLKKWDDYQATFSNNDNVLFVLQFPKGDSFDRDMAMVIEDLTERAWTLPNATRVDSLSNYQRTLVIDDFLEVVDLIEGAQDLTDEELRERAEYAVNEPVIYRALLAENMRTNGVNVNIELQGDPDAEGRHCSA